MECTSKFFRLRSKTVSLKPGLLEQNFSFSRKVVALVLRYFPRNKQNHRTCKSGQLYIIYNYRTTASLKIAVCQERKVALDTDIWSHSFQSTAKIHKIYPIATRAFIVGVSSTV